MKLEEFCYPFFSANDQIQLTLFGGPEHLHISIKAREGLFDNASRQWRMDSMDMPQTRHPPDLRYSCQTGALLVPEEVIGDSQYTDHLKHLQTSLLLDQEQICTNVPARLVKLIERQMNVHLEICKDEKGHDIVVLADEIPVSKQRSVVRLINTNFRNASIPVTATRGCCVKDTTGKVRLHFSALNARQIENKLIDLEQGTLCCQAAVVIARGTGLGLKPLNFN